MHHRDSAGNQNSGYASFHCLLHELDTTVATAVDAHANINQDSNMQQGTYIVKPQKETSGILVGKAYARPRERDHEESRRVDHH